MEDLIKREDALKALNDCIDIKGYAYASMHDALMEIPAVSSDISEPALAGGIENSQHV